MLTSSAYYADYHNHVSTVASQHVGMISFAPLCPVDEGTGAPSSLSTPSTP